MSLLADSGLFATQRKMKLQDVTTAVWQGTHPAWVERAAAVFPLCVSVCPCDLKKRNAEQGLLGNYEERATSPEAKAKNQSEA